MLDHTLRKMTAIGYLLVSDNRIEQSNLILVLLLLQALRRLI